MKQCTLRLRLQYKNKNKNKSRSCSRLLFISLLLACSLLQKNAVAAPAYKNGITIFAEPRTTSTLLFRIFAMSPTVEIAASCLEPYLEAETVLYPVPGIIKSKRNVQFAILAAKECIRRHPEPGKMKIIKIMSFRYGEFMDKKDLDYLLDTTYPVFLIRYPADSIASATRMLSRLDDQPLSNEAAIERLGQIGFSASRKLFDYATERLGYKPLVIEAEEYTRAPVFILRRYFSSLGLNWSEKIPRLEKIPNVITYYRTIKSPGDYTALSAVHSWYERALTSSDIQPLKRIQRNHNIDLALWETVNHVRQQSPEAFESDPGSSWGESIDAVFLIIRAVKKQVRDYHYLRTHGSRPPGVELKSFERPPEYRL